jgi:hypothetical protein
VILVQVGHDHGADVRRRVPERAQAGGQRVLLAEVEAGQPVIQKPGQASGEVVVVGD